MARREEMVGFVQTATINGVEALPVTVEISIGSGLPGFHIIGLPDLAVKEATRRVRQALRASGFTICNAYIVVNLAPSSLRKAGAGFDLPIALAYLQATGQINTELTADCICVGELSLDGAVKSVPGQLAFEMLAETSGRGLITGPSLAGISTDVERRHRCLRRLADLREANFESAQTMPAVPALQKLDFSDVAGNDMIKRALQIAAAGEHGLLMIGPPGAGKSMLASRLPSILPPLEETKRMESALIHSVAGLPFERILAGERPFRSPHHGASRAGLIGGGTPIQPGEVSLAHNGVLFLDELPEFGTSVLQLLRQPIEQNFVALARANGTVTFPARFMLVAAANPCPCGYYGDDLHSCSCTPGQISHYMGRIGGPLLDRINLVVDVNRSAAADVLATGAGTSSATLRTGVLRAREFASWRRQQSIGKTTGSGGQVEMSLSPGVAAVLSDGRDAALLQACQLGGRARSFLEMMSDRYLLSGRGIMSTLAVARTIADMDEQPQVKEEHLMEAIGYRPREEGGHMSDEIYPDYPRAEITQSDVAYPEQLRQIADPPKCLYLIGDISLFKLPALAIVGARKASPYGLACARRFAKRAAFHGLVVVSGGAIGCDQAAHLGALDYESPTIVVLGCGADVVYPSKAGPLFERILATGGLLVSEAPWQSPPSRWSFRRRNRLIAGLAGATLIIEAGLPSGTFSTADATLAQGKELMALPGSILSKQSVGSNQLIAQGALPIIDDISFDTALTGIFATPALFARNGVVLKTYIGQTQSAGLCDLQADFEGDNLAESDLSAEPLSLLEHLRLAPAHPDELIGQYGENIVEVIRCLSVLEFSGEVIRLRDGRYTAIQLDSSDRNDDNSSNNREASDNRRRRSGRLGGGLATGTTGLSGTTL